MRNFTLLLTVFITGSLLGWFAHQRFTQPPVASVPPGTPLATPATAVPPAEPGRTRPLDLPSQLSQLLQSGAHTEALDVYAAIADQYDEQTQEAARSQVLAHASSLIAARQYITAQQLLEAYLLLAYRDVDAYILLAETGLAGNEWRRAIDLYYDAKGHAHRVATIERLNALIRVAVEQHAGRLEQHRDYPGLLDLYRHLTQLEPDHAAYFIGLAAAQLALDDREAARRSLQLIEQDVEVGGKARSMLASLEPLAPPEPYVEAPQEQPLISGVALTRNGLHFLVDADSGRGADIRLLIDTGASMTIIKPEVLERPGIKARRTGKTGIFSTANGPVRAPIYRLDSLTIGDWQVDQLEVGVLALNGRAPFDGLLGMNFLSHFQFFIDQNEALLRLSPN